MQRKKRMIQIPAQYGTIIFCRDPKTLVSGPNKCLAANNVRITEIAGSIQESIRTADAVLLFALFFLSFGDRSLFVDRSVNCQRRQLRKDTGDSVQVALAGLHRTLSKPVIVTAHTGENLRTWVFNASKPRVWLSTNS
jgi:hypothetical protein